MKTRRKGRPKERIRIDVCLDNETLVAFIEGGRMDTLPELELLEALESDSQGKLWLEKLGYEVIQPIEPKQEAQATEDRARADSDLSDHSTE